MYVDIGEGLHGDPVVEDEVSKKVEKDFFFRTNEVDKTYIYNLKFGWA